MIGSHQSPSAAIVMLQIFKMVQKGGYQATLQGGIALEIINLSKNEREHDGQSSFDRAQKVKKQLLEGKEYKMFHIKDKNRNCVLYF